MPMPMPKRMDWSVSPSAAESQSGQAKRAVLEGASQPMQRRLRGMKLSSFRRSPGLPKREDSSPAGSHRKFGTMRILCGYFIAMRTGSG